ncbi:hypothetical protein [Marinobacter sp. S6332]|uniref:hypothetical protein n=1 Tax=Marinobacter sp. S6332 TaxID=2926403 RepID=UPI001FF1B54B|nr:hypothetical protein [Marinobacter sp. S6332]MCK0165823.1 hypothetical protein [Marinobacter sp. S6332]
MSNFSLDLSQSELKIVLEALIEKEGKMSAICESSNDEDEMADIGNDLIELRLLLNPMKERAINKYGNSIVNFSSAPL